MMTFKLKLYRKICLVLASLIFLEAAFPTAALALTGGPSQPEVQSFEPIGTSEMVDVFSGDFNYNIPLVDVGGYPVNLSYHGGISADEEASWVGLGWNINPGVINRGVRSLPDDFSGDKITKEMNIKDNNTFGVTALASPEVFGFKIPLIKLQFGIGLKYNNYKGVGFDFILNPSISAGDANKGQLTLGLGITASSDDGTEVKPSVSYSKEVNHLNKNETELTTTNSTATIGLPFNARSGLKTLSLGVSAQKTALKSTPTGISRTNSSSNGGSSISFAAPSYTPQINMNMLNFGLSFGATLGGELIGLHGNLELSGYYSGQYLERKTVEMDAFGYMYSHLANSGALLDFNREKDGPYTKYVPNLPLANFSYDTYSIAGQGIGGMYRPHRSEVGVVYDHPNHNLGGNINVPGIEIGVGNAAHGGLNISTLMSYSRSGLWSDDNILATQLKFRDYANNPTYESVYFKQAGEKTAELDNAYVTAIGGTEAVRVPVDKPTGFLKKLFQNANASTSVSIGDIKRSARQARNQSVSLLTADQAKDLALVKEIQSYNYNDFSMTNGSYNYQTFLRSVYRPHHISEITSYRPDGARYVFGIPAYNHEQQEVSFAITGGSPDCATGLVNYEHGKDNTVNNEEGLDHYYSKTTTPAYAHSYLLTAVLSPDYIDLGTTSSGGVDGPSDDDLGGFTKINYTRVHDNYQWRVPYTQANYNEGFKSIKNDNEKGGDDKASYLYGRKDVWYVHSIEGRNHVAEFVLEDRDDSYGVVGAEGGLGTSMGLKRLQKIVLYSKEDRKRNGANATPIKTVHFVYDYSLCPGVPNNANSGGKLTLKEVYFTYGKSNKGRLNSYKFNYGFNPSYNLKGYDSWGNYKPNPSNLSCNDNTTLSTSEFPYVNQDLIPSTDANYISADPTRTWADYYAGAWSINSIELPSGGVIRVNYEADDYAYVQDRPAMQMFKMSGTDTDVPLASINPENSNPLMSSSPSNTCYPVLYFKLHRSIPTSTSNASQIIGSKYIRGATQMYYKFFVKIDNSNKYEFVSGYADIESYGLVPTSGTNYTHGYVKLKLVGVNDKSSSAEVHPISKQAWIFTRLNLPRVAFGQPDIDDGAFVQMLKAMVSAFRSMGELVKGVNKVMRDREFGKQYIKEKSWIRLYNPDGMKQGGGSRVEKIVISDEWKNMFGTNQPDYQNTEYGQEYDYTTKDAIGNTISSGVATYEPLLGGNENPFKQPIFYRDKKFLAPDDEFFQEEPLGESFFPAPSVGYGKVTVRNLSYSNVNRNATGMVVNEFYTAKDFPTIVRSTGIDAARSPFRPLGQLLKIRNNDFVTATQGYSIELNDMHGKPKAVSVYAQNKTDKISGTSYYYKTQPYSGTDLGRLDNVVKVIDNLGNISDKTVGVDYDMVMDMREQCSESVSVALKGNLDAFLAAIFPITIPIAIPGFSKEKTRFRSAVATKVINRYGLLDRVEAFDLGSHVATRNLLYDAITGEVLLTETYNQFKDPVYNFTYPAHWAYDGMGPAYKNLGLTLKQVSFSNILANTGITNARDIFVPGDELLLAGSSGPYSKGWVTAVNATSISVVDLAGNTISGSTAWNTVKIVRSGRRNMQTVPVGSVITHFNPMVYNSNAQQYDLVFNEVLNASALEMFEPVDVAYCSCATGPSSTNPFINGSKGNWRLRRNYAYQTERSQNKMNQNVYTREDGMFVGYSPFWNKPVPGSSVWVKNDLGWTWVNEITMYNPHGFELENKDVLGRYSSAQYGYGNMFPKAVTNNSKYSEMGFDGFEDYDYSSCDRNHFSYASNLLSNRFSHTGRKSIKVASNSSVGVTRPIIVCDE